MKRIIIPFSVLLLTAGTGIQSVAQKITNVFYADSCLNPLAAKYATRSLFSLIGAATGCSIESNWGDGSKIDTTAVIGTGPTYIETGTHTFAALGNYTVKTVLICGGVRVDSMNTVYKITCSFIGGSMYKDANADCMRNAGEPVIRGLAKVQVDSAGVIVDTVYGYGDWGYWMQAAAVTVYKFTVLDVPPGFTTTCPASGVVSYTFNPGLGSTTALDFGLGCASTARYDYQLSWSRIFRSASSGRNSYISLYASNSSCYAGTGTVTLHVSPKYSIAASSITPTPASVSGNTITWAIANMVDGNVAALYVPLTPGSATSSGDTACNDAIISGGSDANPANNVISICDSVRASWDPNEKSVSPEGPVTAGTSLSYTIDFENLGNNTAFNIHVQDTLSQYLDVNTFELKGATHAVIPAIYQSGSNNIIKFDFPGINLEDKDVPARNKGQVQFKISLKKGLPDGTVVPNRVGIYFDGNPVVLTNYTYSRITVPSGVYAAGQRENIKVFPNPAGAILNIRVSGNGWTEAVLSNAFGQVTSIQPVSKGNNLLNVAALPAGIYYLQVRGSEGTMCEKIEKQ